MFTLAHDYRDRGMAAYVELQQAEFAAEKHGYTATRHQREVGTGYFDLVATAVSGGTSSTLALEGSTEAAQFTAAGRTGATHAAEQVQAALHEDHGRIESLVDRLAAAKDVTAITGALESLTQLLTEHFAHEEHQKGFYGLLSATSPEYRAQVARMIEEHRQLLRTLQELRERTKGQATPSDLAALTGELGGRIRDHEAREMKLAQALR
jgi:hemerythrin